MEELMDKTTLMNEKILQINNTKGIFIETESKGKIVLMFGGFERPATVEKKFSIISSRLFENNISSFRFDFPGIGLSYEFDFSNTTIDSMVSDFMFIYEYFKKLGYKKISVICHSLSACVVAKILNEKDIQINKIIFIAPALNQKELLRYWFAQKTASKIDKNIEVCFSDYLKYFNEEDFLKDCKKENRETKNNYLNPAYFLQNKDIDYSLFINKTHNILLIHGKNDKTVPIESLNIEFENKIIIENGDHDLEKPSIFNQWIDIAFKFLIE